ncbi:hypothetical protein PV325_006412 [Microctonus aethiopoides]|uniref:Uncharacterized protein n=1 Tax=Microctonus aethiopoides TaxID=144406 RepID=A0AA39F952_9HYME|nr:hypothetical protein PV325_006412 [Microctonus aethiopoides]KAK0165240.1 hypothetical protein PV328_003773 [Microctonus aethiopoides]
MNTIISQFKSKEQKLKKKPNSYVNKYLFLTNDEARVKCALRYLIQKKTRIPIAAALKDTKKGIRIVESANKKGESVSWITLHDLYTMGVLYALPKSDELARAYANRSGALYTGRLLKDAVLDITRAFDIGVPDDAKSKLYCRMAKCYLALDRKLSDRAKKTLDLAREYLDKIDNANRRAEMEQTINNARSNYTRSRPYPKFDYSRILPNIIDENPKIKRASNAIEIQYSEEFGRHIVATRDIEPGETLVVHQTYASTLWPGWMESYCWNCSKRVWAGVACNQCTNVIYCDLYCLHMAWAKHHEIECRIIASLKQNNRYFAQDLLALRLAVRTFIEAGDFSKLKKKIAEIEEEQDPLAKILDEDGVFDEKRFASYYTASRKTSSSFKNALRAVVMSYFLAKQTEIFSNRSATLDSLLNNKRFVSMSALILRYIEIIKTNNCNVNVNGDNNLQMSRGCIFNPLINYFNHSCDPTAYLIVAGELSSVVTLQGIKKGEQIFLCYSFPFLKLPQRHRRMLLSKYSITCKCLACKLDRGPDFKNLLLVHKMTPVPEKLRNDFILLATTYKDESVYYTPEFPGRELHLSVTLQMMKLCQELHTEYTKNFFSLKERLMNIYSCYGR